MVIRQSEDDETLCERLKTEVTLVHVHRCEVVREPTPQRTRREATEHVLGLYTALYTGIPVKTPRASYSLINLLVPPMLGAVSSDPWCHAIRQRSSEPPVIVFTCGSLLDIRLSLRLVLCSDGNWRVIDQQDRMSAPAKHHTLHDELHAKRRGTRHDELNHQGKETIDAQVVS